MKCGCSEIVESSIEEWEKLYEGRYGHKYVEKRGDPYRKYIYKKSIQELKTELFNRGDYRDIIMEIYPRFPKYLGKVDSIILLFDKLSRERNFDQLREKLIEKHK